MWPSVITFDCYGTLVRWPETLRACFEALLPKDADAAAFHRDFNERQAQLRGEPYRPYTEMLGKGLLDTLGTWHLPVAADAPEWFVQALQAIPPYPDVVPALKQLAARFRLAIVSNTEDGLIAETVRGLEMPLEVITAEQARAYKPDHRLFAYAFERLGVAASDVLHVGAGYLTDMAPAFELGLARVWINRRGERADPSRPPTAELPDLSDLGACVDRIASARRRSRS
jgi:2-haloalkanoic acid dehalogenase type II